MCSFDVPRIATIARATERTIPFSRFSFAMGPGSTAGRAITSPRVRARRYGKAAADRDRTKSERRFRSLTQRISCAGRARRILAYQSPSCDIGSVIDNLRFTLCGVASECTAVKQPPNVEGNRRAALTLANEEGMSRRVRLTVRLGPGRHVIRDHRAIGFGNIPLHRAANNAESSSSESSFLEQGVQGALAGSFQLALATQLLNGQSPTEDDRH